MNAHVYVHMSFRYSLALPPLLGGMTKNRIWAGTLSNQIFSQRMSTKRKDLGAK